MIRIIVRIFFDHLELSEVTEMFNVFTLCIFIGGFLIAYSLSPTSLLEKVSSPAITTPTINEIPEASWDPIVNLIASLKDFMRQATKLVSPIILNLN
jgi:hypothetical protein